MSVKACIKRKGLNASCVSQNIPGTCQKAKHRVTKVLRFTLANFETLLQSRGNLKVIHLLRDPRAIVNSRIGTKWYPSKDVLSNTKALCKKMITDYQDGLNLFMKYPNRFRFLYYEDMNYDPKNKIRAIYKYLGMSVDESKYAQVITFPTFKSKNYKALTERETNTAFWWRKNLKWDLVMQIDNLCKDVYDALGYRTFSNYNEMQNLTFKSVNIPQEYALL